MSQNTPTPPADYWTAAERWAWEQVQTIGGAHFHHFYGELDPHDADAPGWRDKDRPRDLSQRFMEDVLTRSPWKENLPRRGLRITGAQLPEGLDLQTADVDAELWLDASRLEGDVLLYDARFKRNLSFEGSAITGAFGAYGLAVDGNLFLRGGATVAGELRLQGAKVGGNLEMNGSSFQGVRADGLTVAGGLFLRDRATVKGELRLRGAKVGGDLDLSEGSLFLGGLDAEGCDVKGGVLLRNSEFKQAPDFNLASIGKGFYLAGATLPALRLAASNLGSELCLAHESAAKPTWLPESVLNLANAQVAALNDGPDGGEAWPEKLVLGGFKYAQLGGVTAADIQHRPASWYLGWLARDPRNGPQPYHQLASVLREAGRTEQADAILYAWKNRELWRRSLSWKILLPWELLTVVLMTVQKYMVGFGVGAYFLHRSIFWVVLFTASGYGILSYSEKARGYGATWMLLASFNQLLPGISLNEGFTDFFKWPSECGQSDLAYWQFVYFCCHNLAGIVLLSFVVAALPNFTRKSHKE